MKKNRSAPPRDFCHVHLKVLVFLYIIASLFTKTNVSYGDGTTSLEAAPEGQLEQRQWFIDHVYDAPGNYTIEVHILFNILYSNDRTFRTTIVIQNALHELNIVPFAEMTLSPPAFVNFTISEGAMQPNFTRNVHCVWQVYPGSEEW